MLRAPKLPILPGYSFDREVGQTRFHKSSQFELLRGEIPYLSEADRPGAGGYPLSWVTPDKTPSIYPRRECKELPGWIAFDKQILTFDAYFQEAMWEVDKCPFQIRKVKIFFYPEDGTIQVNEPRVDNSGMAQGTLINRQRIRFPKPMDHAFYDMIDFNIGKNVELYGKVFRIVNCDKFTRQFLNRMGIYVGDPLDYPEDPFTINEEKKKDQLFGKKPTTTVDTLGKFLKYDRNVLRFYGYWDDRPSQYGFVHKLEIYYYLADDTIEIKEIIPPNSGRDSGSTFMKRAKLPKSFGDLPGPGYENLQTILNVFSTGFLQGRYVLDPINCGVNKVTYYQDNDLAIGACLNVYGRKVVLTDCDAFTKEYYRTKYGMDTFNKLEQPLDCDVTEFREREIPPWNGIGGYEDSEGNCRTVIPKAPKKDFFKMLSKGKVGVDSHVLRFKARMISTDPLNDERNFVVSYYLADDQIAVYERGLRNSGFQSQLFFGKREIFKPDQERFVSRKPEIYTKEDFWIGNILKLEGYTFELLDADDYCMRYMELNCHEFPKSNIKMIMDKIREKVRPIYKDFICKYLRPCIDNTGRPQECKNLLSYYQLESALKELLGDDITKHEIIVVARHYRTPAPGYKYTKCDIINTCRTECKRLLWLGFDRLSENLRYKDPCNTGYIKSHLAYSLCRGAKIPVEPDLLATVLEMVDRNECGDVSIDDLLNFFDYRKGTSHPVVPFNHKREFSELFKMQSKTDYSWVDCVCFLKNLGLEKELEKEGTAEGSQNIPLTPAGAATLPH